MIFVPFRKQNSFNNFRKDMKFGTHWIDSLPNTCHALYSIYHNGIIHESLYKWWLAWRATRPMWPHRSNVARSCRQRVTLLSLVDICYVTWHVMSPFIISHQQSLTPSLRRALNWSVWSALWKNIYFYEHLMIGRSIILCWIIKDSHMYTFSESIWH